MKAVQRLYYDGSSPIFLPRDAMHKRGLCRHAVSVCACVCHVRASRSKRIKIASKFFTVTVDVTTDGQTEVGTGDLVKVGSTPKPDNLCFRRI